MYITWRSISHFNKDDSFLCEIYILVGNAIMKYEVFKLKKKNKFIIRDPMNKNDIHTWI